MEQLQRRIGRSPAHCWWRWMFAMALLVTAVAAVAWGRSASATSGDMARVRTRYPDLVGTRLDTCQLCHPPGGWRLDPYGRDYQAASGDLSAIEALDSDGDGYDNVTEITALTFPGRADDHPALTPTDVPTVTVTATVSPTVTSHATVTATTTATATPSAPPTSTPGPPAYLPYLSRSHVLRTPTYTPTPTTTFTPEPTDTPRPAMAEVAVSNRTGGQLCYEVHGSGIGRRCYAAGQHEYGSFASGTYRWSASSERCGSASATRYYAPGASKHDFWCTLSLASSDVSARQH